MRRRWKYSLSISLAVFAAIIIFDRFLPPNMSRFHDRSVAVIDRDGAPLRIFQSNDEKWRLLTKPADVDPLYLAMLKAYEDKRFDQHWGVDPLAAGRAVGQAFGAGEIVSGASTLTMQAARLLSPRKRTIGAKLIEMARAGQLEAHKSKDEILSVYLTLAPFGGPVEGVRAASLKLFGHEPDLLTPAEAALLIALPQSPSLRRPDRHPVAARAARARVLERVQLAGILTEEAAEEAALAPIPKAYMDLPFVAPHFAEAYSKARRDTVRTALDGRLQRLAETRLRSALRDQAAPATAAAMIIHAPTAEIRAIVANPNYFDRRRAGMSDMTKAVRSPGSALKPFIYGLAFDRLLARPDTLINDAPWRSTGYAPTNFSGDWAGEVSIHEALVRSLNVPAVKVLARLGPAQFDAALGTAGVDLSFDRERADTGLAIALGGAGISMRDVARLYVALANGGQAPDRLAASTGDAIAWTALFEPRAASDILTILRDAPPPLTKTIAASATAGPVRDIAYKTGTSYGYRDAWAAGVIGEYVIVVWVGRPDGAPCDGCSGIGAAAPILYDLADYIVQPGKMFRATRAKSVTPAHLQQFDAPLARASQVKRPVRISFPIDGAKFRLGKSHQAPLTALGGTPPYRWLINGKPTGTSKPGRALTWRPEGGGFHNLVVIDKDGHEAAISVFVDTGS